MVLLQRGLRVMAQALEGNLSALLPVLLRPHLPLGDGLAQEAPADLFTEQGCLATCRFCRNNRPDLQSIHHENETSTN